ncbi:MAG: hypothetical protein Q4P72_03080 [Eubacteriales bacterium]|nr:hypothetical protein [Eubacteriales bacterium]
MFKKAKLYNFAPILASILIAISLGYNSVLDSFGFSNELFEWTLDTTVLNEEKPNSPRRIRLHLDEALYQDIFQNNESVYYDLLCEDNQLMISYLGPETTPISTPKTKVLSTKKATDDSPQVDERLVARFNFNTEYPPSEESPFYYEVSLEIQLINEDLPLLKEISEEESAYFRIALADAYWFLERLPEEGIRPDTIEPYEDFLLIDRVGNDLRFRCISGADLTRWHNS